ncbi:MAG TPA: hypothetical protein PK674_01645 [Candidatus Absconditabacterales bacterium]|nr:hypothetical protein [Candidatus Absconditabacterales bacterium]HOQ78823.1 hypothetical protein [Candidatus Absconditabacterales bacterium]
MNTPKDNINTSRTQEQLREEIKSLTKDNDLYCVAEIPVFFNKKTNQAYSYINGKRQTMGDKEFQDRASELDLNKHGDKQIINTIFTQDIVETFKEYLPKAYEYHVFFLKRNEKKNKDQIKEILNML